MKCAAASPCLYLYGTWMLRHCTRRLCPCPAVYVVAPLPLVCHRPVHSTARYAGLSGCSQGLPCASTRCNGPRPLRCHYLSGRGRQGRLQAMPRWVAPTESGSHTIVPSCPCTECSARSSSKHTIDWQGMLLRHVPMALEWQHARCTTALCRQL
jgi:hypothetical protein